MFSIFLHDFLPRWFNVKRRRVGFLCFWQKQQLQQAQENDEEGYQRNGGAA
jgi:hypothetical protein